jgi:hypothetical protein
MLQSKKIQHGIAAFLAATAVGTAFGAGCTNAQVQAVAAGLDFIIRDLQDEEDDDISFGDWLESELND